MTNDITDDDRATARGIFSTARRTGLFSHPEPEVAPDSAETAPPGNHVAREGGNPGSIAHDDSRELVRALFSN